MDSKSSHFPAKSIFWIAASIALLLLVAYIVMSGAPVKKLSVPGFLELELDSDNGAVSTAAVEQAGDSSRQTSELERKIAELEKRELAQREAALQQRLEELERKMVQREAQSEQSPTPPPRIDLSGNWQSDEGLTYIFQQIGDRVTIQEINPFLGIVQAVGEGTLNGNRIEMAIQTVLGIGVSATLRVNDDGNQISGTVTDQLTNIPQAITLYR